MSAVVELELDDRDIVALHQAVSAIVRLGVDIAAVRARTGEVIALAERHGWESDMTSAARVIVRRLRRVDLGARVRTPLNAAALEAEVRRIDAVLHRAGANWPWS